MNYEQKTDHLIRTAMDTYQLKQVYQEFLDSVVEFDSFKDNHMIDNHTFRKYVDTISAVKKEG